MGTLQDLIEEAKLRAVWWALCIFLLSYLFTQTSKSIWLNIPIAILLVAALRILLNEVEFRWKVRKPHLPTYLSHLERKQLSANDSRLSTLPPQPKWKRKINSRMVEAALEDFVNKLLQDFVVDLWYSGITPDKEAPDLIHAIIMDVLGEVSGRVKEINLVDLLTRDIVDLISDHLDLFRRIQRTIGVDVMQTLSSEERDERLKHHLLSSKELHPALISSESEYKFLQQLMSGVIAVVLRPRESQCPLVRCFARELLTCLVMQPIMNLASPLYINELLDTIFTSLNDGLFSEVVDHQSPMGEGQDRGHADTTNSMHSEHSLKQNEPFFDQGNPRPLSQVDNHEGLLSNVQESPLDQPVHPQPGGWARAFEAATHRRTEVLMPENLENMWARGRNYKKKLEKKAAKEFQASRRDGETTLDVKENMNRLKLKRSSSTSDLSHQPEMRNKYANEGGTIITEYYSADSSRCNESHSVKSASNKPLQTEAFHAPKLKCRIVGAYFEKIGSNSFAVYSIGVTDAENNTWFVKRRYRNFERLHKHLKDIPNYTLHLPPKRIFSSSIEDSFVHQRCILLDKYLQDLLSIANVVEQHEVWDFLSASSKNYSSGKSSSVMRTLAVSVDDAMDDILRQFKGVSNGLMRKVVGPPSSLLEHTSPGPSRHLSWTSDEVNNVGLTHSVSESANSFSDNDDGDKDGSQGHEEAESVGQAIRWHSDNELNSKSFPPRVSKREKEFCNLDSEKKHELGDLSKSQDQSRTPNSRSFLIADGTDGPFMVPPEWTPPKLSLPVLNLVDNVFQLKKRGWLRRQVFWISKQILQLMMEDAIDDWLLRQIHWLRRDEVVTYGIQWIHNVLWPDGRFFLKLGAFSRMGNCPPNTATSSRVPGPGFFEQQLEASRRASDVKKMLFDGAPAALVGLIGQKQYRRCARDIYYFLQSTICLKQLAYAILELVIISIFPELQNLLIDIHVKKMGDKRV